VENHNEPVADLRLPCINLFPIRVRHLSPFLGLQNAWKVTQFWAEVSLGLKWYDIVLLLLLSPLLPFVYLYSKSQERQEKAFLLNPLNPTKSEITLSYLQNNARLLAGRRVRLASPTGIYVGEVVVTRDSVEQNNRFQVVSDKEEYDGEAVVAKLFCIATSTGDTPDVFALHPLGKNRSPKAIVKHISSLRSNAEQGPRFSGGDSAVTVILVYEGDYTHNLPRPQSTYNRDTRLIQ